MGMRDSYYKVMQARIISDNDMFEHLQDYYMEMWA